VPPRRTEPGAGHGGVPAPDGAATKPRILLCEDNQQIRDSLADALGAEAYQVDTAERAVDAIQKVMHETYGALLLDLKLPGLGGLDAISVIKRFDERLPIIVMTGHGSYETEQAARAAGIFYYLVKPFSLNEMSDAVRAAVRSRETGRSRG
jgi:DNA-binding response OmpR family regulator